MLSEIVWRWIQEEKLADIQIYSIQPISFSGGAQSWGYSGCEHQLVVPRDQGASSQEGLKFRLLLRCSGATWRAEYNCDQRI